jgi:hypothetical protein
LPILIVTICALEATTLQILPVEPGIAIPCSISHICKYGAFVSEVALDDPLHHLCVVNYGSEVVDDVAVLSLGEPP